MIWRKNVPVHISTSFGRAMESVSSGPLSLDLPSGSTVIVVVNATV
jgi:hypothetical protein